MKLSTILSIVAILVAFCLGNLTGLAFHYPSKNKPATASLCLDMHDRDEGADVIGEDGIERTAGAEDFKNLEVCK